MDPETKKDLDEQAMVRRFEDDFEADMQARYETQYALGPCGCRDYHMADCPLVTGPSGYEDDPATEW